MTGEWPTKAITTGLTVVLVFSLVALAGSATAFETTLDAPEEVQKPETVAISFTVESDADAPEVENYVIEIRPDGADDAETLTVTVSPDGEVQSVDPERGVVGNGDVRVDRFRTSLDVSVDETGGDAGYGYGYGYGGEATAVISVTFDSHAVKHGTYDVDATVNGADGSATTTSDSFVVALPSGHTPPGPPARTP